MADYCASKGAVDALTRRWPSSGRPHRVYVNAIAPTVVETEFTTAILSNPKAAADLVATHPAGPVGAARGPRRPGAVLCLARLGLRDRADPVRRRRPDRGRVRYDMAIERIDEEICIGCGDCVNSCPMDVIRMDEESDKAVIRYGEDCMNCEQCVLDCPVDAITVTPYKTTPFITSWG